MDENLLQIPSLSIKIGNRPILKDIQFKLKQGETLGIVGESGSGKSMTALSIMGLLPKEVTISGTILWQRKGKQIDLIKSSIKERRNLRGRDMAMIFQEPMSSLNPVLKCGEQIAEALRTHQKLPRKEAEKETLILLEKVRLPAPERIFHAYPHELSGGQRQRVMIAMALSCSPALIIADEATTALDATVQREILCLFKALQKEKNISLIFISHDLGVIRQTADHLLVMYKGEIVESGPVKQIFDRPQHPYTCGLISCKPGSDLRLKRLPTIDEHISQSARQTIPQPEICTETERSSRHRKLYASPPLLTIDRLSVSFKKEKAFSKNTVKVLDQVSFEIHKGETLGLVGESGSGKTTLGRSLLLLQKADSGHISFKGRDIADSRPDRSDARHKQMQIIFQDPYSSLNPRLSIGEAIAEPMRIHRITPQAKERKERVHYLLEKVGLEPSHYDRYPHEFSGGQRQRIGIARALALEPEFIVCDECVSALDVSVQALILNLLNDLKTEFGLTYLFISHDWAVVKHMSDRLMVMNKGRIEEIGEADQVYRSPRKAYTKALIEASFTAF